MAMTMNGEVQLAAPREAVWAKLNDPEVLKACIPGCEELERTEDNGFRAVAKMKVGPVSARFKGRVTLSDLDPPNGYKISGEGEGGVAGFAKGGATVGLSEKDGGTLLSYDVEAQIGGKLAQLGQRLINGAAKKLADEFFANFAKAVQGSLRRWLQGWLKRPVLPRPPRVIRSYQATAQVRLLIAGMAHIMAL
jgi:carbon monoxide dehydrogenase subunit G